MEIEKKQQLSMYDQSSYFCPPPPSQAAVVVPPMSFSGFTPMISSSSEEINHHNHNHHHHQNYCPHHLGLDMKQDFYNGQSMMANPDSLYNLSFEEYPINGAASSSSFEYALQYGFPGSLYDHEREGTTIGMGGGGDSELLGLECGLMERRRGRGGGGGGGDMGKVGFASEKQRREKISEKYEALRSMIPNPTKVDRASIIADATDYIKELLRTVDELKILVEKKRYRNERLKRLRNGEDPVADMESSSSLRPLGEAADQDRILSEPLRSSWLQRKSKETTVDVRIVDDEVTIKLSQRKRSNCLLSAVRIFHELHLELLHVAGGNIGDYHIFMFNTKIYEGSSVYASAIAKKLIEVVDRQYMAIHF